MEDVIIESVMWNSDDDPEDEDDDEASFDDLVDMGALMGDMDFARTTSLTYLPANYPPEKANQVFFGLYRLLKAREEYVPELAMEYALYKLIMHHVAAIDLINGELMDGMFDSLFEDLLDEEMRETIRDGEFSTIVRISDPYRRTVFDAALELVKNDSDLPEDKWNDAAEDMIMMYEDMRNYKETCFWDTDFLFLDQMSEDELRDSEINEEMGILTPKHDNVIEFPMKDRDGKEVTVKATVDIKPWDLEND